MRRKARVITPRLSACCTLLAFSTPCLAAGADPLPAVTVTATRLPADAFSTPAAVDSVDGDTLREGQLQVNLSETLAQIPGVFVQNRQNFAQDLQISSRGFGARASFGVRGIKVMIDGIPAGGPDGQAQVASFSIGSAERVEVLRGPYSALYGNAAGGVIQLVTRAAPDAWRYDAGVAGASAGTSRLGANFGVPITNAMGATLDVSRIETDGLRAQSAATRELVTGRIDVKSADATFLLTAHHLNLPSAQDPLGLTRAQLNADPDQTAPAAIAFNTRKSTRQSQIGGVADWRLTAGTSLRAMAYGGRRDVTQFQSIPVAAQAPATHPGGVIEFARNLGGADLRVVQVHADGMLRMMAGIATDIQREDRLGRQNFVGSQLGVAGTLRRDETNHSQSRDAYAQVEWVRETLAAFAGIRATRVKFVNEDRYVVPGNPDDSGSRRYAATTPVTGVAWNPGKNHHLFASIGRGVETPTANELAYRADAQSGLNLALQPARSRHIEAGWRGRDRGGQASLVWFRADTEAEIAVLSNSGGRATFQNAGRTRRSGLEAALDWRLHAVLSAQFAFTSLNARYRDSFRSCATSPCLTPDLLTPAGNRLPGAPQKLGFAALRWQAADSLAAALEWRHQGRMMVDDANSDAAGAASTLAGAVTWRGATTKNSWRVSLRGENLTNRRGAQTVIVNEANARYFEPRPARSLMLSLEFTGRQ